MVVVEDTIHSDLKLCECGCGTLIPKINTRGKPARFKWGHNAVGAGSWLWKGGRKKETKGYITVKAPWHLAAGEDGYILEHRLIYEEYYKCCLLPWGVIHHRNGKTDDNRVENLEGMLQSRHREIHKQLFREKSKNWKCVLCGRTSTFYSNLKRQKWYKNEKKEPICAACYEKMRRLRNCSAI